jgi:hypothetical protein
VVAGTAEREAGTKGRLVINLKGVEVPSSGDVREDLEALLSDLEGMKGMFMEKLKFEFGKDGSCQVSNEQGTWDWSKEQVIQTCMVAKVCTESRQGPFCDCTACQCFVAFRDWKESVPKFILHSQTRDSPIPMYDEDRIISDGVLGRITEQNVYLTTYAQWPDEKRPADLEVGECIKGVYFSLSGSKGWYDIYRVQ